MKRTGGCAEVSAQPPGSENEGPDLRKQPLLWLATALVPLGVAVVWTVSHSRKEAASQTVQETARDPLEACVVARIRAEQGDARASAVEAWLADPQSPGPGGDEGARLARLMVAATMECAPTTGTGRRVPLTPEQRQAFAEYMERAAELQ